MGSLSGIRDRIRLLATIDPDHRLFGASAHEYQLAPPLTETELAELEAGVGPLPAEYRGFVRTFAAHGAGPYYGLLEPRPPGEPRGGVTPTPAREFRCDRVTPWDAPCPPGAHLLDGTVILAEQGGGGRSLLIVRGPRAGEVWQDGTRDARGIAPEAPNLVVWYEQWIARALLQWCEDAAPRIALDGPSSAAELEAIGLSYEIVEAAGDHPATLRTLAYLHLRERRFADAEAAFARATQAAERTKARDRSGKSQPHHALDLARVALVRGDPEAAIVHAQGGLASDAPWHATRDELYDVLEQALISAGRRDDALEILDQRAAERTSSFDVHHRLARERLARNDVGGAGAALERAARMTNILGEPAPLDDRVPASFNPIIRELRSVGRHVDADALAARVVLILDAN